MLTLLTQGQFALFALLLFAIIASLTLHEFGHAWSAHLLGDDTARLAGRLTLNPIPHIDPIGLLMVVMVGFGYARPVPVNPRRLKKSWGHAAVAAAGPGMNLLLAFLSINLLALGATQQIELLSGPAQRALLVLLAQINILLMAFNLIPLGPLDGRYVMEWALPDGASRRYTAFNNQYGVMVFLALIALSIFGVPVFSWLLGLADKVLPWLIVVPLPSG
ncbi:MAG: site-2 protease family protein [Pseudomonadota bacterium]